MTPITDRQRNRARKLLDAAERSLRSLCEERLNLDSETRHATERAVDSILLAHSKLSNQPPDFPGNNKKGNHYGSTIRTCLHPETSKPDPPLWGASG